MKAWASVFTVLTAVALALASLVLAARLVFELLTGVGV